jgi:uncharacterized protein (DUF2141 family)
MTPGTFALVETRGTLSADFTFNKPLKHINFDSMAYQVDSLNNIHFDSTNITWDSLNNKLTLKRTIDKKLLARPEDPKEKPAVKKTFQLIIGKGAFVSTENDSSKQQAPISIKPLYFEDTGILIVNIQTNEPHFLVQLLDKGFNIIRTERDKKKIYFDDLPPSEYQIRLIIDTNNDGKWTPGNFQLKQPAEPTKFYKTEKGQYIIKLKANFEIGPLLITF